MNFEEMRDRRAEERDFDDRLRRALTEDALDVSPLLARVRQEMQPAAASRRHVFRNFVLGAIAAGLLIAIVPALLTGVPRRSPAIAVDAACDHYDEVVRLRAKKWHTSPADVGAYLHQHFPHSRDLVGSLTPPGASFKKVGTCRLHGLRFAHFVYRSGTEEISVFVRLTEPGGKPLPRFDYHDDRFGLQVAGFNTRRYEGLIVSTLASGPTRDLADGLARRL